MVTTAHQDTIIQRDRGFLGLMRQGLAALTSPTPQPHPTLHQPAAAVKPNAGKNLELILKTLAGLDEKSPERQLIEREISRQQQRMTQKNQPTREQALQALLQNPQKAKALQRDLGLESASASKKHDVAAKTTQASIDKIARGQELNTASGLSAERGTAQDLTKNAKLSPQQAAEVQNATQAIDREASQRVTRDAGLGQVSADPAKNLKRVHQAQQRGVDPRHVLAKKSRD